MKMAITLVLKNSNQVRILRHMSQELKIDVELIPAQSRYDLLDLNKRIQALWEKEFWNR